MRTGPKTGNRSNAAVDKEACSPGLIPSSAIPRTRGKSQYPQVIKHRACTNTVAYLHERVPRLQRGGAEGGPIVLGGRLRRRTQKRGRPWAPPPYLGRSTRKVHQQRPPSHPPVRLHLLSACRHSLPSSSTRQK